MTTTTDAGIAWREIKPEIGAEVLLDKQALLSGDHASGLRDLLEQRGILLFPKIHFSDDEQVAFTKTLGTFAPEMGGSDVYKITLDASQTTSADYLKATKFWHFDGFSNKVPIRASLLSSKVVAEEGGNTGFANTYAAYEALPDDRKAQIEGLRVMHGLAATQLYINPEPSYETFKQWVGIGNRELPLVWTHQSGRKSLVLGNSAVNVIGMPPLEGLELLIFLRDWATQERFSYSHKWQVGDAVMWDNTGTLHRAEPYPEGSKRMLHRTKLQGEEALV